MLRRCETLLLVMVVAIGCRRVAQPPPTPPASEPISSGAAPASSTESPAPSGSAEGLVDEAAKIEAAKNKEAPPSAKTAPSGDRDRAPAASGSGEAGARRRAAHAAEEELQPKSKQRVARAHGGKKSGKTADTGEGKVVAEREDVGAADLAATATVQATLRFKNEAGATYKLVEARFVMDGAELPTVITSAERGATQQVFSGQVPAGHHVVASRLTYQGADRAIFSYMKGYTFHVKSDDEFFARGKNAVSMTIVCKEKTGFNDPVERRLFVTVE
jgi:hypothetical protein